MATRRRGFRLNRVKCRICGMYRGRKPHTGPVHEAIRAARKGKRGR